MVCKLGSLTQSTVTYSSSSSDSNAGNISAISLSVRFDMSQLAILFIAIIITHAKVFSILNVTYASLLSAGHSFKTQQNSGIITLIFVL